LAKKVYVEKNVAGRWEWESGWRTGMFAVNGNRLEVGVARPLLGLTGDEIDLEFKWNDNMQEKRETFMDFLRQWRHSPGR